MTAGSDAARQARARSAERLVEVQRRADRDEPLGVLHSAGMFMHLVRDPSTGAPLAPTYSTLADQLVAAEQRLASIAARGGDPWGPGRVEDFMPYPELFLRAPSASRLVAVVDSGVLADHPLLEGRIADLVDFTGEGMEDRSGHGTIQAIRQAWHEPRAQLLIVKAFGGPNQRPSMLSLSAALDYLLRLPELGFVFIAGGIDARHHPQAHVLCEMADDVVAVHGLVGRFVATRGNVGDEGVWCPAHARSVVGLTVADHRSLRPGLGPTGGMATLQSGSFTSFPEIIPLPLADFHLTYARQFADRAELPLALHHAWRAATLQPDRPETWELLVRLELRDERPADAARTAQAALAGLFDDSPATAGLTGQLGRALLASGHREGALLQLEDALSRGSQDADVAFDAGRCLELLDRFDEAGRRYLQAARLDPAHVTALEGFGLRQFYGRRYDLAQRLAENLLAIDPTFAAARYNAAACCAARGDTVEAYRLLADYEAALSSGFSTDLQPPSATDVREAVQFPPGAERAARLRFVVDGHRRDHASWRRVAQLVVSPTAAPAQDDDLSGDLLAILRTADRVGLQPAGWQHPAVAGLLQDRLSGGHEDAILVVDGYRSLGRLKLRAGDVSGAYEAFLRSAELADGLDARRSDRAFVDAARVLVCQGRWQEAERLLAEVYRTAAEIMGYAIGDRPDAGISYTTPSVHAIRSMSALQSGDREGAQIEAQKYFHRRPEEIEAALVLAASLAPADIPSARTVLRRLFRRARRDAVSTEQLLRWLEDYPPYDELPSPGSSVRREFTAVDALWSTTDVQMASASGGGDSSYEALVARLRSAPRPVDVVVVGAGLAVSAVVDPAEVVNLTTEPDADPDGTTTGHAAALIQALGGPASVRLSSVKAVGTQGGSIQDLVRAVMLSVDLGATVLLLPVSVELWNWHLLGAVRQVSESTPIVAAPVQAGVGEFFPAEAAEFLVPLDPPSPRVFTFYDHPGDYPEGYVLREWLLGGGATTPGQAWFSPDLDSLRKFLPPAAKRVSGSDPTNRSVLETWM